MAAPSAWHLLEDASGELLGVRRGELVSSTRADDRFLWRDSGDPASPALLSADGAVSLPSRVIAERGLSARPGPSRLPSEHLADLRANGFTVLESVLDRPAIDRLKTDAARVRAERHGFERPHDGQFWMTDTIAWSAEVARAVTHPVALWLLERYLETDEIHYGHQPIITTLKPAKRLLGASSSGGWHADYPYHPGVFPDDRWPSSPPYGVQFNICVDSFRPDNGATEFVPGSHERCQVPPASLGVDGTRVGEGAQTSVRQLLAPAGAAIIYDARTWHRACPERNVSGVDRLAILNAVTPSWVAPMADRSPGASAYRASEVQPALTARERAEIDRLVDRPPTPPPPGAPALRQRRGPY